MQIDTEYNTVLSDLSLRSDPFSKKMKEIKSVIDIFDKKSDR